MDEALPISGAMTIVLPFTTLAVTSCNVWPVTTDLKYPTATTSVIAGTLSGTGSTWYCSFKVALTKNTAYGIRLS